MNDHQLKWRGELENRRPPLTLSSTHVGKRTQVKTTATPPPRYSYTHFAPSEGNFTEGLRP